MQQYLVIARDGSDEGALERRMRVRPMHLDAARKLKTSNNFITGGATLDEQGKMNGSMMLLQFESDAEMQAWYDNEPYIIGQVWQHVEIRPFRVADI